MSPQSLTTLFAYVGARVSEGRAQDLPGGGRLYAKERVRRLRLERQLREEIEAKPGPAVRKPAWLELCDAADAAIKVLSSPGEDPQAPTVVRLREAVKVMRAAIATGVDIRECGSQWHQRLVPRIDTGRAMDKAAKLAAAGYKLHPSLDCYWAHPEGDCCYLHEDDIELVSND